MNFQPFKIFIALFVGVLLFSACEEEVVYEKTRLFRPVLNEELTALDNTIIVNMGNIREAVSYTLEVSRDSFQTIEYTIEADTNYVIIGPETLNGEELFWNTLYQVQATAHAADAAYDSRISDLGNVRTERFPSILQIPTEADIIDRALRVTWTVAGAPVTMIRIFGPDDLGLDNVLLERETTVDEQTSGIAIFSGLTPETGYQVAIYSAAGGTELRGWEGFMTLPQNVDPADPNVIDLSNDEDPDAVVNAMMTAVDGNIILLKKGVLYNLPSDPLDKSITITAAYGFGDQKAILFTTGNWNFAEGVTINHVRFIDVELRGEDIGGDYVFNPNLGTMTRVEELTFDNCVINHFRGVIRIRSQMFLGDYNILNSVVHHIGGYGIITTDTDGAGNASFDNALFQNSTFYKIHAFMTSRQNAQSITIDACTMSELADPNGIVFRWRGEDGVLSNVLNGISITNTVWGHAWDEAEGGDLAVRGIYDGLEATSFNIINTWSPSDFAFTAGSEIPGFPALSYSGTAQDLWVAPYADEADFNFKDSGFAGKYDSGDPRWRAEL
ncbi:MAG: DUF5123 domain-containing protein [Lewinella sp.]|nr:DUF5123 domain-containing protein [Lewinella sp.]